MVGRGKVKQARSKRPSRRWKEDRISKLPDCLICQILYHLPTKEAVKTSVLSTRWKSLWLWVPSFELGYLDFNNFHDFISFGDKFFDSSRVSLIDKVKLNIDEGRIDDESYLKPWIDAAVKRKIHHLDVCCLQETSYEMPRRLYTCETLVSLKLYEVKLDGVDFVSLPCVKTMHLKYLWYRDEATFERLVSCCPVLEELKIFGCVTWPNTEVFRVLSRSLKKLRIKIDIYDLYSGSKFVIDAPRLSFLSINDNSSESFIINDMGSNAKVDISLSFGLHNFDEASVSSRRSSIRSFLLGISKVSGMIICRDTFKLICQYSKLEPLPQLACMFRLRVSLRVSYMKWLPTFLESCANLKSLSLVWNGNSKKMRSDEMRGISFSSVPECLLSSLEFVEIETSISGYVAEMKLIRYFLENSTILKKLTLHLDYYRANENVNLKKLLKIPRRSITCQVVID